MLHPPAADCQAEYICIVLLQMKIYR